MRAVILDRIRDIVRRHRLLGAGDRVIIGLSGGPDSVTLSHLLPEIAHEFGATVVGLAHLNHQLRPSAEADEQFCRQLAERLRLPLDVERADVRAAAREARTSLEDGARRVRYAFLRRVAVQRDASRIAVAHNRNDQAETVLFRLFRGAGTRGLAAIRPRVRGVIRPLLDTPRLEIERFLADEGAGAGATEGLGFRVDPTNADVKIPRNRIRHELLPYLARHFGPGVVDVLARQATLAREDAEWLEQVATETAPSLVLEDVSGAVTVDIGPLLALPPALGRRVLRLALTRHAGGRFLGFAHVDAALALARAPVGPSTKKQPVVIDLPGQRVKRIRGQLRVTPLTPDPGRAGRRRGRPRAPRTASTLHELEAVVAVPGAPVEETDD
jgi:tRNA(Ile)-lysidine synthase